MPGYVRLEIDWGDGQVASTSLVAAPSSCQSSFSHTYTASNLYTVTVTATDVSRGLKAVFNSSSIAVYDTSAGFLTAGDMQFQNGIANFGLVCTYAGSSIAGNNTFVVRFDGKTDSRFRKVAVVLGEILTFLLSKASWYFLVQDERHDGCVSVHQLRLDGNSQQW